MTAEMRHIGSYIGKERLRRTADPDAGGVLTKHGWLSFDEIHENGGKLAVDANGNRVLCFPERRGGELRFYREIPSHKLAEGEAMHESLDPAEGPIW